MCDGWLAHILLHECKIFSARKFEEACIVHKYAIYKPPQRDLRKISITYITHVHTCGTTLQRNTSFPA